MITISAHKSLYRIAKLTNNKALFDVIIHDGVSMLTFINMTAPYYNDNAVYSIYKAYIIPYLISNFKFAIKLRENEFFVNIRYMLNKPIEYGASNDDMRLIYKTLNKIKSEHGDDSKETLFIGIHNAFCAYLDAHSNDVSPLCFFSTLATFADIDEDFLDTIESCLNLSLSRSLSWLILYKQKFVNTAHH